MNGTQKLIISVLAVCTIGLIPFFAIISEPKPTTVENQQADDGWQVEQVGGMAFDKQNSNVYLTSSATNTSSTAANTTAARCLIRMLSFSAENGFASVNNGIVPKGSEGPYWPADDNDYLDCPGDPRCMVRRNLKEEFQPVDETVYPDTCSKIYIEKGQAVILGHLPREQESMSHGGSVMVMKLDSNKIGGDETQEFRLHEEPLVAAFDGKDTLYLASRSRSRSGQRSITLYRYSKDSKGSWQLDWHANQVLSEASHRIHIASLNVVLGGQYLVLAGTVTLSHGQSFGHFGFYHTRDGSTVDVHGSSTVLQETQKHDIECVCLDEERSGDNVAILYRVSTVVVHDKTVSIVNKLRLEKERNNRDNRSQEEMRQSHIWTQEIMHTSMKKCQVANGALVLAGYLHSYDKNNPALTIAKRSTLNGEMLWTAKQSSTKTENSASHHSNVQLADIVVDNQNNVLVYGQVVSDDSNSNSSLPSSNGDDDDIVLLQALHGSTGNMLAQTSNSPPMVVKQKEPLQPLSTDSNIHPRSWNNIVSREELMSNYTIPMTIMIVGLVVSTLLCIWVIASYRESAHERETKTFQKRIMDIFSYLRPFEANEVDLQQSPTGGFNGTYTDELINKPSETEQESVLSDSERQKLSSQL
mmetsp:Transcript_24934/g.61327  ORF Transcript_24934/g.61327 Transcript_24934/m.61327 type:complete len:642 (-) Transcript_24934:201-2126(-)